MLSKIKLYKKISLIKFLYYNFFSSHVERRGKGFLLPSSKCKFLFYENSKLQLSDRLSLGCDRGIQDGRTSLFVLQKNSKICATGNFVFWYGADVTVFEDAIFELGNSFINSNCVVRCHKHIKIGDNCAISHNVTIMDGNAHVFNGVRKTEDVVIGNNVWIGTGVIILPGTIIGDGSVVMAGSVVKGVFPSKVLIAGMSAKVVKENVNWSA